MIKKILAVIGGLLALAVLGIAGFLTYFLVILPEDIPIPVLKVEQTPERVERGHYLANQILGCMYCHSERDYSQFGGPIVPGTLGKGGEVFDKSVGVSGTLVSQNITPYNLGDWSDGELYLAITSAIHKDGYAMFPIMPSDAYRYLITEDVYAIIAYLRTLHPIEAEHPQTELTTLQTIIANSRVIPAEPMNIDWGDRVAVGSYYARIGGCSFCHTTTDERMQPIKGMRLAGGMGLPAGGKLIRAANISADPETGIGNWTEEQFIQRFKAYQARNIPWEKVGYNSQMAWPIYAHIKDEDLAAIFAWIMAQPPVKHEVQIVNDLPTR
jgi:cytochrome c553